MHLTSTALREGTGTASNGRQLYLSQDNDRFGKGNGIHANNTDQSTSKSINSGEGIEKNDCRTPSEVFIHTVHERSSATQNIRQNKRDSLPPPRQTRCLTPSLSRSPTWLQQPITGPPSPHLSQPRSHQYSEGPLSSAHLLPYSDTGQRARNLG